MTLTRLDLYHSDPLLNLGRADLLELHRAWFEGTIYAHPAASELYGKLDDLNLRIPTARIITNRHLGLEITTPPEFKIQNEAAQSWLNRILKLNGVRGAMRGAAATKSWAGDVGLLFSYKPSERDIFGTAWQIGFIEPETYEVHTRYASGVFKEVDIYTFEDKPDPTNPKQLERWWTCTRYSREKVTIYPAVRGVVGDSTHPGWAAFDTEALRTAPTVETNHLGVIPFVIIQNATVSTQNWWGASDYLHLTQLFYRIDVGFNTKDTGEQIRNKLMLAIIDGEEVEITTANGISALEIKSNQDGTSDMQARLVPTPLLSNNTQGEDTLSQLMDVAMEAAGVAQTGSAKELFGNEAASSSALKTYYSMQTAVAQHKRDNWLGERADYGLSAFARKLFNAASKVDGKAPFKPVEGKDIDLDSEEYDLKLDWPPMFALSAAEQQTMAAVAQQAADSGLPAQHIAPLWGKVLDAMTPAAQRDITAALEKAQQLAQAGLVVAPTPSNGILGSGQGNGLADDGGDTSKVLDEVKTNDITLPDNPKPTLSGA